MPHYFFRVRGDTAARYEADMPLSGKQEARREALRLAGMLLAEPTREFWHTERWAIDVVSEADVTLFTLTFFRSFETSLLAQRAAPHWSFHDDIQGESERALVGAA